MANLPFPGEYFKMINILFIAHADAALRSLGLTCAQSDVLMFLSERSGEETTVRISASISASSTRPSSALSGGWRIRALSPLRCPNATGAAASSA